MSYYKTPLHLLVLVCEYLKSTHGFVPGYFPWPYYEEEYLEDGPQEGYDN